VYIVVTVVTVVIVVTVARQPEMFAPQGKKFMFGLRFLSSALVSPKHRFVR
jgi:hypothetical protein